MKRSPSHQPQLHINRKYELAILQVRFGSAHATAIRVKRLTRVHKLNASRAVLGGSDQIRVQHHANLPAQQIKQNRNPLAFGHALEQTEAG